MDFTPGWNLVNGKYYYYLDDGTMAELLVPESLYRMEAAGEEIVVCQRDSLFSIRMVDLHLPTEEK